jgi:GNAT superfamily N-acetyltransferase
MDQSPYTIHARVQALKYKNIYGDQIVEITAHHPDYEGPIGGLSFQVPSGSMTSMEIHPDHRNGVVAAKLIEKAVTVANRLGVKTSNLEPSGTFTESSANILNKLFPKSDGTKYKVGLDKGFTFTRGNDPSNAYGRPLTPGFDEFKCPACFGSHRLGLEPEDMQDPVKVAQGYKECPHCDEMGMWNGTDKE